MLLPARFRPRNMHAPERGGLRGRRQRGGQRRQPAGCLLGHVQVDFVDRGALSDSQSGQSSRHLRGKGRSVLSDSQSGQSGRHLRGKERGNVEEGRRGEGGTPACHQRAYNGGLVICSIPLLRKIKYRTHGGHTGSTMRHPAHMAATLDRGLTPLAETACTCSASHAHGGCTRTHDGCTPHTLLPNWRYRVRSALPLRVGT